MRTAMAILRDMILSVFKPYKPMGGDTRCERGSRYYNR